MRDSEEVEYMWKLWTILVQLENLVWEQYSNDFIELNMDQGCKEYPEPPQDDDIPF